MSFCYVGGVEVCNPDLEHCNKASWRSGCDRCWGGGGQRQERYCLPMPKCVLAYKDNMT